MWIVRVALNRPYTFVVLALLILGLGPLTIGRTPTDIFPDINIPVVTVVWNYGGLSAEEMANRIVSDFERALTTTVNDIEHIESQSLRGIAVVKVFLQPGAKIELAIAQITAVVAVAAAAAAAGHAAAVHHHVQRVDACRCCSSRCRARGCRSSSCTTSASTSCARSWRRVQGAQIPYPLRRQAAAGAGGPRSRRAAGQATWRRPTSSTRSARRT